MVLKPLDAALKDHDHIYSVVSSYRVQFLHIFIYVFSQILGTGINSCGSVAPVSAPVASAQRDAMKRAFHLTGRRPEEVDFLELHATGQWVKRCYYRFHRLRRFSNRHCAGRSHRGKLGWGRVCAR